MSAEKALLSDVKADSPTSLPHPNSTAAPGRKTSTGKKLGLSLLVLLSLWTVVSYLSSPAVVTLEATESGYLSGIAEKGYKFALGPKHGHHDSHDKHGHHGDHDHPGKHGHHGDHDDHGKHGKHDHHDHHDHHGPKHRPGPGRPISPKAAEDLFLQVPNNSSARDALKRYTANAHPAGSGFDLVSALNLKNEWEKALGIPVSGPQERVYDAGSTESQRRIRDRSRLGVWIDTYYPVMNTPVHASVTLYTETPFHAKLREDIVEGDPDSVQRDAVPVFHGLSISGDVRGQYVYVGYGRKTDFDTLVAKGVDFNGKIALVKYGRNFRGLKIKAAQEAGAIGVLIFTDPGDDGEITEANGYAPYPEGPARQPSSVQRGSVQFISKYPGDPSTPGEPAYKNATRVEGSGGNQPSIPSLPISYEDAIPILKALEGKGEKAGDVVQDWVGGLGHHGVEYWTGPSDVDIHLVNEVDTRVMPIWNTVATIPGHIEDEVIIVGNHRDAWVLGGADPNSGTASQYELIRGLGHLIRQGWKPLRTIILASWDAEEYGLIGSTEWAEDFGDWLKTDSAAYINLDSSVSGSKFGASASPSLAWLIRNAAEEVLTSSDASRSVWDAAADGGDWKQWRAIASGQNASTDDFELETPSDTGVKPLGSGSDYTAFLQRYGVASGNFGYGGGPKDAVYHYHSIYDSFTWQEKYSDPGFHRHVDVAKILGLTTLRLADSLVLPINTTQYALELEYYLEKVQSIAKIQQVDDQLNLTSLGQAIQELVSSSHALDQETATALKKLHKLLPKHPHKSLRERLARKFGSMGGCGLAQVPSMDLWEDDDSADSLLPHLPHVPHVPHVPHAPRLPDLKHIKQIKKVLKEIRGINKKRQGFESGFISEEGIKDREWYKHKGVAPGAWLGYGATTFPALTEALTLDKDVKLAQKEADELTELIRAMRRRLEA